MALPAEAAVGALGGGEAGAVAGQRLPTGARAAACRSLLASEGFRCLHLPFLAVAQKTSTKMPSILLPFAEVIMFDFPLLVLKGVDHCWEYLLIFSEGLSQMASDGFGAPGDARRQMAMGQHPNIRFNPPLKWVWLKIKKQGLRRFWSMFPLTRVPFWYWLFEPQPNRF